MLLSLSFPQLRRWFLKGGIAVLDQGIFSGSNFVFNILLARWLDPAAYGAFSVLFAIYLFLSGFHNALIMEPMTVLGPALYLDRLREFVATQFKLHFFMTGGMSILVILVGALLAFTQKGISFGLSLAGLGIFLPFMLLIWLARRIFYVLQIPAGALLSSIVYAIWLIGCSFALVYTDSEVGLSAWFGVMGLAALFGSMAAFWFGKVKVLTPSTAIDLRTVMRVQANFGRWLVVATVLYTIGSQLQVFFIAGLLTLEAAGAWRALQNFSLPMVQAITAISTLALPSLSAEFGRKNMHGLRNKGLAVTVFLSFLAIVYEMVLIFWAVPLESLLYEGKYESYIWFIPIIGMIPIVVALEAGFSIMVRAFQKPQYYATYTAILAVSGLAIVPLFILKWGITGAIASQLIVEFISLVILIAFYRHLAKRYGLNPVVV